jgi:hypothetical protein
MAVEKICLPPPTGHDTVAAALTIVLARIAVARHEMVYCRMCGQQQMRLISTCRCGRRCSGSRLCACAVCALAPRITGNAEPVKMQIRLATCGVLLENARSFPSALRPPSRPRPSALAVESSLVAQGVAAPALGRGDGSPFDGGGWMRAGLRSKASFDRRV